MCCTSPHKRSAHSSAHAQQPSHAAGHRRGSTHLVEALLLGLVACASGVILLQRGIELRLLLPVVVRFKPGGGRGNRGQGCVGAGQQRHGRLGTDTRAAAQGR